MYDSLEKRTVHNEFTDGKEVATVQAAIFRLLAGAREGLTDTQVEFGRLLTHTPVTVKLDEDPTPLEQHEIVLFKHVNYTAEDVGVQLALMRCTNGQYLVLGEVS